MEFKNLKEQLIRFKGDPEAAKTKEGAVRLFCSDCDFYKESDKDLECGAFKLLRLLIDKGTLTMEQLADAVGQIPHSR